MAHGPVPMKRGFGLVSQFNTIAGFPKGIMVDCRTGRRFVDELADRKARSDAILNQIDENGKPVYPICFVDSEGVKLAQTLKNGLKYGVIRKFDTLEELAKAYGIPTDNLIKQVNEFNEYVRNGKDEQFNRPLALAVEITKAPFYAARVWPKVHYCMGSVLRSTIELRFLTSEILNRFPDFMPLGKLPEEPTELLV